MGILACSMTSGSGCPETNGGPHYFAFLDEEYGSMCIDCGEPAPAKDGE